MILFVIPNFSSCQRSQLLKIIYIFLPAAYLRLIILIISYRMSFLDKFKGKTQFLTKGEVSDILGSASVQQNVKLLRVRNHLARI